MKSLRPRGHAPAASALKGSHRPITVLLFDIDGTLVLTGGAGGRAMTRAFHDLFAVRDGFAGIPMPGRTDAVILADAARAHGIPESSLDPFRQAYLDHLKRELLRPAPPGSRSGVMPGVRALLDALVERDDVFLALLTGNYREGARAKLEHFDLWRYFACGAFGDRARDRNMLLPAALAEVRAAGGPQAAARDVVVVGDTPHDVACAQAGGARSIAVATGSYGMDALRAAGADEVFADFSDTDAVLTALARP